MAIRQSAPERWPGNLPGHVRELMSHCCRRFVVRLLKKKRRKAEERFYVHHPQVKNYARRIAVHLADAAMVVRTPPPPTLQDIMKR
jgi:hypothetical protein